MHAAYLAAHAGEAGGVVRPCTYEHLQQQLVGQHALQQADVVVHPVQQPGDDAPLVVAEPLALFDVPGGTQACAPVASAGGRGACTDTVTATIRRHGSAESCQTERSQSHLPSGRWRATSHAGRRDRRRGRTTKPWCYARGRCSGRRRSAAAHRRVLATTCRWHRVGVRATVEQLRAHVFLDLICRWEKDLLARAAAAA
jgi:hypothetical protein